MTPQTLLSLLAAGVGFASAIMFCIGSLAARPVGIYEQSCPRWDFSEPVARALTSQQAQFSIGALLLVISFCLQVAATLEASANLVCLPQFVQSWPYLVPIGALVFLLPASLLASIKLSQVLLQPVLQLAAAAEEEEAHTKIQSSQLPVGHA